MFMQYVLSLFIFISTTFNTKKPLKQFWETVTAASLFDLELLFFKIRIDSAAVCQD